MMLDRFLDLFGRTPRQPDPPLPPPRLPEPLGTLEDAGITISQVELFPDGHGTAIGSMPLPKDHWLLAPGDNVPPMFWRCGNEHAEARRWYEEHIREAARYAIRASTMNGAEIDFDPDAMARNFITAMVGYNTDNGLSGDDWANPEDLRQGAAGATPRALAGTTVDNADARYVAAYLIGCALAFEPNARVVGNARSRDIVRAVSWLLELHELLEANLAELEGRRKVLASHEQVRQHRKVYGVDYLKGWLDALAAMRPFDQLDNHHDTKGATPDEQTNASPPGTQDGVRGPDAVEGGRQDPREPGQ